ncbi:hypothetical protein [Pseudoalteromonas phenolica]|uniref:hypothetical protein n=1 Tax=Pseudoalteromonas phenolica TaxID=161398 RepID=UPI00110C1A48|nr:hypothetical protein [Pseudoalteromonas phenolica]TMO54339.1 hypothetical protein CWC21_15485 [Pseudoalteromonas phenolica]
MRIKNYKMNELNEAAELLAQVEGGTIQNTGLTPVEWDFPWVNPNDPIGPFDPVRPPFQMSYGIWIPDDQLFKLAK